MAGKCYAENLPKIIKAEGARRKRSTHSMPSTDQVPSPLSVGIRPFLKSTSFDDNGLPPVTGTCAGSVN